MKNGFLFVSSCCALLLFASCEKVINVDVKDSEQRIVIEGIISDEPGLLAHTVYLSRTNSFSAANTRTPVRSAFVEVVDINAGVRDTLVELLPGEYVTKNIAGIPGHTYQLTAVAEGKTFTSSSTMPAVVPFDSVYTQSFSFFGTDLIQIIPVFTDLLGTKNYYRFMLEVNDTLDESYQAWNDLLSDGKTNTRPLISRTLTIKPKDSVLVWMECTDKGTYDYFLTLDNASGNAQTPSNPTSNISGNGLGYFSALTREGKLIVIPEKTP